MFETTKYPFIHSFLSLYTCEVTPGMGATRKSMTVQLEEAPGGHSHGGGCWRGGGWQLGPVIRLNLCCNKKIKFVPAKVVHRQWKNCKENINCSSFCTLTTFFTNTPRKYENTPSLLEPSDPPLLLPSRWRALPRPHSAGTEIKLLHSEVIARLSPPLY
jgi:hypothetical protein